MDIENSKLFFGGGLGREMEKDKYEQINTNARTDAHEMNEKTQICAQNDMGEILRKIKKMPDCLFYFI